MGILRTKTIEPATCSTLTLGASGDTITVSSDSIKANTFKDAGGNTLFTSDGAGTLSSVNSALAPAGPILISTSTASSSSSIDITSGIDSTYDEYMFVLTDINPDEDDRRLLFQCSIDGGSNYNVAITSTNWRAYNYESAGSAAIQYDTGSDQAQGTAFQKFTGTCGTGADESIAGILHLFSPSSTTYVKHFYAKTNDKTNNVRSEMLFAGGYINVTAAITNIQFSMSAGNFDGKIKMYGVA